jgi:uncharacterized membrane protein
MTWKARIVWLSLGAVGAMSAATSSAAQIGGRPARPVVIPPQGEVRQVIFKNCTSCHGIDDYAFNSFDRAGWNAYIDKQHHLAKRSRCSKARSPATCSRKRATRT